MTEDLKDLAPPTVEESLASAVPAEEDGAQLLVNKIFALETSLANTRHDLTVIMSLLAKLGEIHETELKTKQVDGGTLFYWQKAGRILMPN